MREYEMLTKLMRLLTIKLVKIQYKMRMPGIGEDTMKSVLLCSPPGGGTMGGGLQDLLQDPLTLAFAHGLLVFHTGVLSLPWTMCAAVCTSMNVFIAIRSQAALCTSIGLHIGSLYSVAGTL